MQFKPVALAGCALVTLAAPAFAQESPPPGPGAADDTGSPSVGDPIDAEEIVVTGRLFFRNRTEDPNPVISYDLEYFQRFEPVSVGEMLKRLPGITFTSDVLEYDGVQVRGLPAGFTQVLINGRRAPGGEADRSFFVDRVPAELIERIEIVRAPRADQPSEGVAGTINIVTKESVAFDGGFAKIGALINEDGAVRPSGAIAYADELGEDTSFWVALNYQERRNPKEKVSFLFDGEVPEGSDETSEEFENVEFQDDTRDGTDISGNAELTTRLGEGRLRLSGLFIDTDRDEDELSSVFEGVELEPDGVEVQRERISQQSYALSGDGSLPLGPGELVFAAGWSGFRDDTAVEIDEGDSFEEAELVERERLDLEDNEYSGTLSYAFGPDNLTFKLGGDFLRKERDGANRVFEIDDGVEEEETEPGAIFAIRETRYDPYALATWRLIGGLTIDAGLRYEITRRDVTSEGGDASYDEESLNPSAHLRYAPTPFDQFRVSVARTVRRPDYDLISPYRQEETPGDEDETIGNPALRNQRAWGVDAGYERRLWDDGILGINVFYRDISDLIELVATGEEPESGGAGNVFQPRNIGDGETWGVELDFSASLSVLGLPDTGIFANYTYLDSEVRDPFTGEDRRFNDQPHHLYNIGLIQTLASIDASVGASLSGRSDSLQSNFDETVELSYEPDLEAFVEKRIGDNFVLRFSAQNLLNRSKGEVFRVFDGDSFDEILANRASGDIDEFEIERERSGRLFQLTLRAAF